MLITRTREGRGELEYPHLLHEINLFEDRKGERTWYDVQGERYRKMSSTFFPHIFTPKIRQVATF